MKPKAQVDEDTAAAFRCDVRTARRWRMRGAPVEDHARMCGWLAVQRQLPARTWDVLEGREPGPAEPEPPVPDPAPDAVLTRKEALVVARTRLANEQAAALAQKRSREAGDLMPRVEVERLIQDSWGPVASFLAALPSSWPSRFTADTAANAVVLEELARTIRKLCRDGVAAK